MKIRIPARIYELGQVDLTNTICVFTDGSGTTKGSPGGWAFVIARNGSEIVCGAANEIETTNNRMELSAAIHGLRHASDMRKVCEDKVAPIALVADSMYVLNQAAGNHVATANLDLIEALRAEVSKIPDLIFVHVKGHSDHLLNDRADSLAKLERKIACDRIRSVGQENEASE